jgi:hypothetical protein
LLSYILAAKNQEIEDIELEFGLAAAMILKHVERWPTLGIERDDLAIEHGFFWELFQRPRDRCKERWVKFFPLRESN